MRRPFGSVGSNHCELAAAERGPLDQTKDACWLKNPS
jgi:hypothetical protein